MATWRDGPEYAPRQRPEGFTDSGAPPLPPIEPIPPAPPLPSEEPGFAPPEHVPELAALLPATAPHRDPKEAFEVHSAALTEAAPAAPTSGVLPPPQPGVAPVPAAMGAPHAAPGQAAWASAHSAPLAGPTPWDPNRPFVPAPPLNASVPAPYPVAGPPQQPGLPGTPPPAWYPPPPQPSGPGQVSFGQVIAAMTPALLIVLGVGALIAPLTIAMLVVATALSSRVRYRRQIVRWLHLAAAGLSALIGLVAWVADDFYLDSGLTALRVIAQISCLLLPFAVAMVQAVGIARGDRPEAP